MGMITSFLLFIEFRDWCFRNLEWSASNVSHIIICDECMSAGTNRRYEWRSSSIKNQLSASIKQLSVWPILRYVRILRVVIQLKFDGRLHRLWIHNKNDRSQFVCASTSS